MLVRLRVELYEVVGVVQVVALDLSSVPISVFAFLALLVVEVSQSLVEGHAMTRGVLLLGQLQRRPIKVAFIENQGQPLALGA